MPGHLPAISAGTMRASTEVFRCLLCGRSPLDSHGTRWACRRCGHVYPLEDEIPILVRSREAHEGELERARATKPNWYLSEQPIEEASPWRHHVRKRRLYVEAAIGRYLRALERTRAETLLDLGCGDGNHLEYLRGYAEACFGSDFNLVRLARARRRRPDVVLFLADILDYPCQDDAFEIIFFNHVLEHIPRDEAALATVFRILRPHGLLVLGTPNEGVWWWQLAYRLQPQTLATTDHVHFYTAETLGAKLVQQGFTLLETAHMGWGPPHWGIDGRVRRFKVLDDLFEAIGRRLCPRQASSLYVLATKR